MNVDRAFVLVIALLMLPMTINQLDKLLTGRPQSLSQNDRLELEACRALAPRAELP